MSSSAQQRQGIDQLLSKQGKSLKTGDSTRFRLVKGAPISTTADPVDVKAPTQSFPLMAKFSDSVVKPQFKNKRLRCYQQDVPKAVNDSDEEEDNGTQGQPKKKRWRYRQDTPKRQWILQTEEDFLEKMLKQRKGQVTKEEGTSDRYEGQPEHNPSRYAVLYRKGDQVSVQMLPPASMIPFAQPAARKTFTLSQAEQVLADQRNGVHTMHDGKRDVDKSSSKARLLGKFQAQQKTEDDDDNVMADVTFAKAKKSRNKARSELLNDLGDGVKVSDDGVLGGTNDQAFGGRQRFGNFHARAKSGGANSNKSKSERGADGAAMADDFYQRDVQAEYEDLDYDANEQFDDDDVDLGEAEVVVDGGGFGDDPDDDGDDVDDNEADDDAQVTGAAGLATAAGFQQLLAKARGEVDDSKKEKDDAGSTNRGKDDAGTNARSAAVSADGKSKKAGANGGSGNSGNRKNMPEKDDHIAKIMSAAEKTRVVADKKTVPAPSANAEAEIQFDEHGLRILNQYAVRREIWLNHGSIPTKRLMKIFSAGKKSTSKERNAKFREIIKELCTMRDDPVNGRMLVLKQHYSNM